MKQRRLSVLGFLIPALGLLLIYGIWVEARGLSVRHVYIDNFYLAEAFAGKTLVHISDLHIAELGERERTLIDTVNGLKPDLLILTGDYVKWNGDYEVAMSFLSQLKAAVGIWAVMGDYDYSNSRKSCVFCHGEGNTVPIETHKIHFMRNSLEELPGSKRLGVWVGGVDAFGLEFDEVPHFWRDKAVILLSHSPLMFDYVEKTENVLMLAGDTHGGQIPLPSLIWRIMGYRKNARYEQGVFREGKKMMIVSRGIGTSHFPIRVLRRPEITVLHFQAPGVN